MKINWYKIRQMIKHAGSPTPYPVEPTFPDLVWPSRPKGFETEFVIDPDDKCIKRRLVLVVDDNDPQFEEIIEETYQYGYLEVREMGWTSPDERVVYPEMTERFTGWRVIKRQSVIELDEEVQMRARTLFEPVASAFEEYRRAIVPLQEEAERRAGERNQHVWACGEWRYECVANYATYHNLHDKKLLSEVEAYRVLVLAAKEGGKMKIRNFTPHELNVFSLGGKTQVATFPSEGNARVSFDQDIIIDEPIPIVKQRFGPVTDLPDPVDGVRLVVSRMVASALPNRMDLLVPGDPIRDSEGKVIGSRGLAIP